MQNGLPNQRRSSLKIVAIAISAFAILLVLTALCLPMFFSTSAGKKMLARMIGNRTGLQIEIEELSLSWFGSQSLQRVHAQKTEEKLSFNCQTITTDASLIQLAFKNDLGHLKLISPDLEISKPFQSTSHIRKQTLQAAAVGASPQFELAMPQIDLPMRGQIIVENGKVGFTPPGLDPISFDQIALSLDMMRKEELAVILSCNTRQQQAQGQIAIRGSATKLKNPFPELSVQSTVTNLPMLGIDQLASIFSPDLSGLLLAAVGNTINLQCDLNSSSGNFNLKLNAQSPQITAQIATQSTDGTLSLKNPATINFNVTPALLQKLGKVVPSLATLSMTQPSILQMTLSQLSCPLTGSGEDLLKASFQGSVDAVSPLSLVLQGSPLILTNFKINAASSSIEQGILLKATSGMQTQGQTGSFAVDGNLVMLKDRSLSGNFSATASRFPVDMIGTLIQTSVPFSTLLGPSADLNCAINLASGQPKLHLSWQSANLSIPELDMSLSDPWTLTSPASFSYGLTPQLFTAFFPDGAIKLSSTELIKGVIKNFTLPPQNIKNAHLELALNAEDLQLGGNFPLNISKLQAALLVDTLDQISLNIDGSPIKIFLFGALNPITQEFTLKKPLTFQCLVDNPLLKGISQTAPQLLQPARILLSIDPMVLPLNGLTLDKLKIKGQLSTDQLTLSAQAQSKQVSLQNLIVPFQWDAKARSATLQLNSVVQNPSGAAGNMQGQFTLTNFSADKEIDFKAATIAGTLDLQNISSAFLDAFSGNSSLSALTGSTFSSKFKLQSTSDKQNIAVNWTSPYLNADATFVIDSSSIQLQGTNNQLTWNLTPEGYKALDAMITGPSQALVPFEIKEPSVFSIALSKMSLPVSPKQANTTLADRFPDILFDLSTLQFSAKGSNPKLSFYDKSSQEVIQLSALTFSMDKGSKQSPLNVALDTSILSQNQAAASTQNGKTGALSLIGKLETTLNPQGAFDISQLTGNLQLKIQQMPSRVLDLFARAKGRTDFPFTTVFGNLINATASCELKNFNGPLSVNLNTPLSRASLSGNIVNGALLLNDSIYAQLKITPEMSRLVLKEINPLNLSYIYSKDPITLEIPAKGFYFPIYPTNLGKIAIPEATIELGKITCRNEGNVNIALGLLKTKQFDKNNDLMLWFAPIELSVQKGFVDIERTEILLADTFDICLWGKVDLLKDYVDMVLGLTAQTLSKAFGIKNLPEKYVLTISMKGPADNVQINTGKATAKVALLLAWQQQNIAGAIGGGPAGAIVGELLKKMATLPDSDAKIPPAKHPFPWEIGQSPKKTSENSTHEKKRHFKQNEKPLKQILKVIK